MVCTSPWGYHVLRRAVFCVRRGSGVWRLWRWLRDKGMSQRQSHQPPPPGASYTFRFCFVRAWWRLLLLLRVPAPRVLRAGLWAPWLFPAWRSVRFLGALCLVLLRVLLVLLLPFLVGWLLFG